VTFDCLGTHEEVCRHLACGRSGNGQLNDLLLVRSQELGERRAPPGAGSVQSPRVRRRRAWARCASLSSATQRSTNTSSASP
jgi:hypothetical protein